ncbi:MAG: SH3 domain-containing protein [Lachnospiraceae bacterium]|nr:SH3 domain-containing protein [Lachnospiraceae bacterium]
MKTKFAFILMILCIYCSTLTTHATEYDPGAGRLSGDGIAADFYEDADTNKESFSSNPIKQYGSRKLKSPYTGVKYTHKTVFDGRTIRHGIDVSKWQGEIDWAKVKAAGIDYAFIQVGFRGYGDSGILNEATKDPYFDINMKNAIANGIQVGVYVFSQATTEAEAIEEASYILDAIHGYSITMPLVMDFEYASTDYGLGGRLYKAKLSKKKATAVCMAFCKEIAAAGYTPMVYANKSMLEDQIFASTLTDAGYRIWLANYTKSTGYSGTFDFWQYSEKGKVSGIYGDVDMNFYYVQENDNFAPQPNSISLATFTEVPDTMYTGSAIIPQMTVTHNGTILTPNVDYTITYTDNVKVGTATITIQGMGNYCDTRKIRFQIQPNPVSSFKAKKRSTNFITLSWKKDSSIKGYEIYRADKINGTFNLIKTIKKNSSVTLKNTGLTAGRCYFYQIRSYKVVDGKTYYSEFSPVTPIYTKTGYTRNALTKTKAAIYDYIPGTKTETIKIPVSDAVTPEKDTEEANTEQSTSEQTTTEQTATEQNSSEQTTTAQTTAEQTNAEQVDTTNNNSEPTNTEQDNLPQTEAETTTQTVRVASTVLATTAKNESLSVIYSIRYKKQTWYYVKHETTDGIYKGYIRSSDVTITKLGKIVKTKQVNVRKKATAYSKKLTTLKRNKKVTILETKKKQGVTWYKVRFKKNGKTYNGWISAPYIKII